MYVFCSSFPSATFALQHDGFVPREWLAAKSLLQRLAFQVGGWAMAQCPIPVKNIITEARRVFQDSGRKSVEAFCVTEREEVR